MKGLKIACAILLTGPVLAIVATTFMATLMAIMNFGGQFGLQWIEDAAVVVFAAI